MVEIKPTSYANDFSSLGLKEMCNYIAEIRSDILVGLDSLAIYQKYIADTADLRKAVVDLNGKVTEVILCKVEMRKQKKSSLYVICL